MENVPLSRGVGVTEQSASIINNGESRLLLVNFDELLEIYLCVKINELKIFRADGEYYFCCSFSICNLLMYDGI